MGFIALAAFIVVGMIFYSFIATIILFSRQSELLEKLSRLETRLKAMTGQPQAQARPAPPPVQEPPVQEPRVQEPAQPEPRVPETVSVPYRAPQAPPPVPSPAKTSELWNRIEKQFIDNWTGILGSVIMVMGIAFLSIYAALKMAPFYRFLMLNGFAAALFTIYLMLRARSKWLKLAIWLRSSGCAVFLFACLGAGGIPGLQWIDNPLQGLALLLVGVTVNLVTGALSGSQFFASFHAVLSLAALAIAPQSPLTLGIAVAVSLLQVLLTYRDRWEYHLLITITSFLAYHLYWIYEMEILTVSPMPLKLRLTGIAATAVIGVATAFVHYREVYGSRDFDRLPFIVHLFNWFYMGVCFFLYSTGSKWNTVLLMVAGLAAFALSRRAKKLEMRWLFTSDTLIAQSLALLAVYTLQRWQFTGILITSILMLEVLVFLAVMLMEEEKILQRVGVLLYHLAGVAIVISALAVSSSRKLSQLPPDMFTLVIALAVYTAFHIYLVRRKGEAFDAFGSYGKSEPPGDFSISGFLVGLLGLALFGLVYNFPWAPYAAVAVTAALLWLRYREQLRGLEIGILFMAPFIYMLAGRHMNLHLKNNVNEIFFYGLPFLLIPIIGGLTSYTRRLGRHHWFYWIYLFSVYLTVYSLYLLTPTSTLLPGVLWLLLAAAYFQGALFLSRHFGETLTKKGEPHRFLLHWGYIFIGLFIIRHMGVHLQSGLHAAGISARLLLELAAVVLFIYWGAREKPAADTHYKSWRLLHPLMSEAAIFFTIMMITQEVGKAWRPAAWVLCAYLLLMLGKGLDKRFSRLRFYTLFFHWAAALQIAFVSTADAPSIRFLSHQAWFGGLIALLLQMGFVAMFYWNAALETVELPEPVSFLKGWVKGIHRSRNVWIYYPFFLATAVYLIRTFDSSLLTLLLVVEAFVVFTLSIVLRENHFRYAALLGLAGCLFRLMVYDLARSGTFTRALVFLGVGVIMILMNSLYNKYRTRFKE